jgi:signal peptidase II
MIIKKYWIGVISFIGVLILDLVTKDYIITHFPLYHSKPIIPGLINLVHVQNKGVAFGILGGSAPVWRDVLLLVFPILAISGMLVFALYYSSTKIGVLLALGGIMGGATGNLIDRIRFHAVIDFIDVYWKTYHWPAFNVADSAISIGVLFLIFFFLKDG